MWLSDLKVVLPDRVLEHASVRLEDGFIAEIREGSAPRADLHGSGLTLIPGIIDVHGDMLERELEPRPGAQFPMEMSLLELDKRLAAAGVTTAYAAISFQERQSRDHIRSAERAREIIREVQAFKTSLLTDTRIHVRFEVTNPSAAPVLLELLEEGAVDLVSLNDHTPGQGQYRDLERFVEYVARWRGEDQQKTRQDAEARIQRSQKNPPAWDVIAEVTRIARENGLPIASHDDDTPAKVDLVHSLGSTLSEFPVTLEAALEARKKGMQVIMGAPNALRGKSHSGNLSAREALKHGVLDILAADYYPAAMLKASLKLHEEGLLDLPEAIRLITLNPALAVNLMDRGSIEVGKRADLVLLDEREHARIVATLRKGRFIYWGGHPVFQTPEKELA